MTNPRDPDSGLEELLRSSLHGEAETISPSGDGLARIQQRTAARGRRLWLRPVAVVGGAAVAAAAGFTAYAVTSSQQNGRDTVSANNPTPLPPTTPPATPTTSTTPTAARRLRSSRPRLLPVHLCGAGAELGGAARAVAQPWIVDPVAEAKNFVKNYVLVDGVDQLDGFTSRQAHGDGHPGTHDHRRRFEPAGEGDNRASCSGSARPGWCTAPSIPRRHAQGRVACERRACHLSGDGHAALASGSTRPSGVDVRHHRHPSRRTSGHAGSARNATWSATVAFAPPADPRGAVVVDRRGAVDFRPGAMRGDRRARSIRSRPVTRQYFYAVKNNRISKFSSQNGASLVYLTEAGSPGDSVSDPQLVGDQVYFLAGPSCANSIQSVPSRAATRRPSRPQIPATRSPATASTSRRSTRYYETACVAATSPAARLVINTLRQRHAA